MADIGPCCKCGKPATRGYEHGNLCDACWILGWERLPIMKLEPPPIEHRDTEAPIMDEKKLEVARIAGRIRRPKRGD